MATDLDLDPALLDRALARREQARVKELFERLEWDPAGVQVGTAFASS